MEHLAIMRKSWGLTDKILDSRKKIESRWYSVKYPPWNNIQKGEMVFFKDSGRPVGLRAEVEKVLQFDNLTQDKVKNILDKYGKADGIEKKEIPEFFERFKNKKYCMLIFLKNPITIAPFEIDKTGFGAMAAWIIVKNISQIRA